MLKRVGILADLTSRHAGSTPVIMVSIFSLLLFLVLGPVFKFSAEYQIFGNTIMSAASYVMLFVIQHSQNRDGRVLHIKMDAIIRALENSDRRALGIEHLPVEDLDDLVVRMLSWPCSLP